MARGPAKPPPLCVLRATRDDEGDQLVSFPLRVTKIHYLPLPPLVPFPTTSTPPLFCSQLLTLHLNHYAAKST